MYCELKLTGHMKGKTVVLNKRQFIDGVHVIGEVHSGKMDEVEKLAKYFQRCYRAELVVRDTRKTLPTKKEEPKLTTRQQKIFDAVLSLDPDNMNDWTQAGLPRLKPICDKINDMTVSRRDVEEVFPNGYIRPGFGEQKLYTP